MEQKSYISPEMKALLGKETIIKGSEPVDAGKIRRFGDSPSPSGSKILLITIWRTATRLLH